MKSGMLVVAVVGLGMATTCLGVDRAAAERQPVASPVLQGMEEIRANDPEIYDHFADLLSEGFDVSTEDESISMIDNGNEKFVVVDVGGELQMYLLVKSGEEYEIAAHVAIENWEESLFADGSIDLLTTVLESDAAVVERSIRIGEIRQAFVGGKSAGDIARGQAAIQGSITSSPQPQAQSGIEVSCSSEASAVCCGFVISNRIRLICVCHKGSGEWKVCFDSGWSEPV